MELYNILKKEIEDLRLTDEYEIAYYIYIRMGEELHYDAVYTFSDENARELLKVENEVDQDINDVKKKHLCFSWALLYKKLLNAFGIEAWYRGSDYHAYVEFKANGKFYIADLMKGYLDISLIKFGFPVKFFREKGENEALDNTKLNEKFGKMRYVSPQKIFDNLYMSVRKINSGFEQSIYVILKFLERYLSFYKNSIDYTGGKRLIDYVLAEFKRVDYNMGEYYDLENDDYVLIYYLYLGEDIYFAYRKDEDGCYSLHEVSETVVEEIMNSYETDKERCLTYYQFS